MKIRLLKSIFPICCLLSGLVQAAVKTPDRVVLETVNGVIEKIENQRTILEAEPSRVYDIVNELIIPHFDFVSMSKWVLGKKNWQAASSAQRNRFTEQFKTLLVRTYARALLEYSGQEMKLVSTRKKPDSRVALVETKLISKNAQPFPVKYRMLQKNGNWKVIDVSIDGVSLIATYRRSFASQISENGFDSLIQQLANKNNKLAIR